MATPTHFQGGDGDWGLAGNWSGIEPVSNDTAIIDAGSVNITAGLDNNGVDLDLLWISPGYTGNIGSPGSRLTLAADLIVHLGQGNLYLQSDNGAGALTTDRILICCANPDAIVDIDADDGSLEHIQVLRGNVTIAKKIDVLLEVGYKQDRANDATVTIQSSAGTSPAVRQWGGKLTSNAVITLMDFYGGLWTHEIGAVADVNAMAGGRIVWNAAETLATLRIGSDCRCNLIKNDRVKTITEAWEFPGLANAILADLEPAGGANPAIHTITTHHQLSRLAAAVQ